jgi:hypothetical protein
MYLNPLYICVCIILFAAAFIFIIILQLQIIHLRAQQACTKECLCDLIDTLYDYLQEERNAAQDRLNEITGAYAHTSERFRKSHKIEKIDEITDKIGKIWED